MIHKVWELEKFQTATSRSLAMVPFDRHIQFPTRLPLQLSLSCTVNETLSFISQNLKRLRDSGHIPFKVIYHTCTSTPVYQSACKIWSA